ncbi:hypothetical protein IJT10_04340, partial [bacterium]|nr:hypothetical protein [bacterium]
MKSAIKYTIFSLLIIVVIGSFYALWSKDREEDFLVKYEEYVPQDATFVAMGNINEEGTLKKIIDQFMQESVNFGIFSYIDGPGILCSNLTSNGFKEDTYLVFIQKVNDSQRLGEACEIIKKYFAKDNLEYAEEDFLRLKINAPKDGQRGFSWAVGKDLLVMASSSKDIKMIFTPSKDWKSIKDLQVYKDAKAKIADCNKGFMFWRIPETFGNLLELGNLDNLKKCKYMISGLKKESSTKWRSLTYLECDPSVLKSILNGEGNVDFNSLKYHPHANSCCLGFNAKTVLNIFKSAMSNVAEAKQEGSSLKISYNPIEKYMDMISKYVTGELVLSIDGLGKYQGKNFFNKES